MVVTPARLENQFNIHQSLKPISERTFTYLSESAWLSSIDFASAWRIERKQPYFLPNYLDHNELRMI